MDYLNIVENNINEICNECCNKDSEKCNFRNCNIGFADYVIKNIKNNSVYVIDDGESLIPRDDLSYYDERIVAKGVAAICKLCKQCNEKHNENCVISLIRRTLEYTQLKDKMVYPGNTLLYLMELSKQNPKFSKLINQEYMNMG